MTFPLECSSLYTHYTHTLRECTDANNNPRHSFCVFGLDGKRKERGRGNKRGRKNNESIRERERKKRRRKKRMGTEEKEGKKESKKRGEK